MLATVQQCIEKSLAKSKANVSCAQTSPASAAPNEGTLIRDAASVYVEARKSSLIGKLVPAISLMEVGLPVFVKIRVEASLGNLAQTYANSQTTQIPRPTSSLSENLASHAESPSRVKRSATNADRKPPCP